MEVEEGILFLFFIVVILWTVKADFFLLIFVVAAYLYLLFLPINYEIQIPSEIIMEALGSVISRIPSFFLFLLPIITYNIYRRWRKTKETKVKNE